MQSMAGNHNKGRQNLKKYAEQVLFKAYFAVLWAPKKVVEPTTWVQTALDSGQTHLFII